MPFAELVARVAHAGSGATSPEVLTASPAAAPRAEEAFYERLPEVTDFKEVVEPERYVNLPPSSLVVLTDVCGSTRAIEAGRYGDVNALGVACIVGLCNAVPDIQIAYMFGGDGATAIVPASRRAAVEAALRGVRALAESAFGLGLRASIVPLTELLEAGHAARVLRFRTNAHTCLAMFSGSAFSTAERWFKDPERGPRYEVGAEGDRHVSFAGFECRWQPLASQRGHTVSLIVCAQAPTEAERTQTYRNLLRAFERIVDADACHPIKLEELKLQGWFGDYSVEARIRAQASDGPAYAAAFGKARRVTCVGKLLGSVGLRAGGFEGKSYKRELVRNCDFRKFDDTLRMLVDLNVAEIYRLESRLSAERRAGRLVYGLHCSPAALVTCLVRSYEGEHVHFVDGADGGYALAAKQLKAQLSQQASAATNGGRRP